MAEDIYGTSVPHLQGKKFWHKNQHMEPVMVPSVPKDILDKYKKVTLCCNLIQIDGIVFLNNTSRLIMFVTGSMIKNRKIKNNEDGTKQFHKVYLQRGLKTMRIHADI